MRRSIFVAVALVLFSVLAWRWSADVPPPSGEAAAAPSASIGPGSVELEPTRAALPPPRREAEPARKAAAVTVLAPAPKSAAAQCSIFGRVLDGDGLALAAVPVRVSAYQRWAEGHDVPRLSGRSDMRGFEALTSARGEFRIEGPTPTSPIVVLEITPDDYHDSVLEFSRSDSSRTRLQLHAGENDLGEFRLVSTGAIAGRVTDVHGAPIADAELNIGNDRTTTLGRYGRSEADGRYVIAHVKAGVYGVNVKHEGHLSEFRTGYEVETGRTTGVVDFRLAVAPTLRGVVVAESGAPIEGAKLWCWPRSSGQGAGATSAADGTFTVFLPQDEPYTLECKCEGFEPFGVGDRESHHEPGTRDLRVVMQRGTRTTFRVVDAETRAPIEDFGIRVFRENYNPAPQTKLERHPNGEVEQSGASGLDHMVVRSPGYEDFEQYVKHDTDASNVMTVELKRASRLSGRALLAGEPVVGVDVLLESGRPNIRVVEGVASPEEGSFTLDGRPRHTASTGADGRFVFDVASAGLYRLTLTSKHGEISAPSHHTLAAGVQTDVGDVELAPASTIVGRVLVPARRQLDGITIRVGGWTSGVQTMTDTTGAFRFERLAPGVHELSSDPVPGRLGGLDRVEVVTLAGRTTEAQLDLTDCGTCEVALTVLVDGRVAEGVDAYLFDEVARRSRGLLGRTDAEGRVVGWTEANGHACVRAFKRDELSATHPTARFDLRLDERVEATLDFVFASLSIELPPALVLPTRWRLELTSDPSVSIRVSVAAGEIETGATWEVHGRRLRAPSVPVGVFDLQAKFYDLDSQADGAPFGRGGFRPFEPIFECVAHVEVRAGAANQVRLE